MYLHVRVSPLVRANTAIHPAAVVTVKTKYLIAIRILVLFQPTIKMVSSPILSLAHFQTMSVPILLNVVQR